MSWRPSGLGLVAILLLSLMRSSAASLALPTTQPAGVDLPAVRSAEPVLPPLSGTAVDREALETRLTPLLSDADLGRHLGFAVYDLSSDQELWMIGRRQSYVPASTLKLFTASAVLETMAADHRFATTVVQTDEGPDAATAPRLPQIVLVGGGDPLLTRHQPKVAEDAYPQPAALSTLVQQTVRRLRATGTSRVSVGYDASLFTGPEVSPTWEPDYVSSDVVSPISALWVDQGLAPSATGDRVADPARSAAHQFAAALEGRGVRVAGMPVLASAAEDDRELARVESPPLEQVVGYVLEYSDNEGAEVLLRHLALATGRPASFVGGVAALQEVLTRLEVPWDGVSLHDGSGLSREDRITLPALVEVFRLTSDPEHARLRVAVTNLPVAGFTGSLAFRFTDPASAQARGIARAKTGTLSHVHALAGTTVTRDGTALAFVAIADRVRLRDTLDARDQLDRLVAGLAGCGCAATSATLG